MKKIALVVLVSTFTFLACQKEEDVIISDPSAQEQHPELVKALEANYFNPIDLEQVDFPFVS